MKNIEEILIVNGIGVLMMLVLLHTRRENRESKFLDDRLFDGMVVLTMLGCALEALSFVIDGLMFPFARALNYFANSLCFIGPVSIGYLWCVYMDLRLYRNLNRTRRMALRMALPLVIDVILSLINLAGVGVLFTISDENIYQRQPFVAVGYIVLLAYFSASFISVMRFRQKGVRLRFFPIYQFVVPCVAGTVVQWAHYGIAAGWIGVAIALIFLQMQSHSEDMLIDALSGLFNRRYLDNVLRQAERRQRETIYGIMIDMNDFKQINDRFGHSKGDVAIRAMGNILSRSIVDNCAAIRYAGDEFIVLMQGGSPRKTEGVMSRIQYHLDSFNRETKQPFRLSAAMGWSKLEPGGSVEKFMTRMDAKMYADKQKYHS